jgi:hypothetical protein
VSARLEALPVCPVHGTMEARECEHGWRHECWMSSCDVTAVFTQSRRAAANSHAMPKRLPSPLGANADRPGRRPKRRSRATQRRQALAEQVA